MKIKTSLFSLAMLAALPMAAQIFNFSLRTNNQQLIDEALDGAFVRINQSYELCDTTTDERFGRGGRDYFNIVPFIGVLTEEGLVFPTASMQPWDKDIDFDDYRDSYKPLPCASELTLFRDGKSEIYVPRDSLSAAKGMTSGLMLLPVKTGGNEGLVLDTVPGLKNGWLVWLSSESNLIEADSLEYTSFRKEIEVSANGEMIQLENPEITGKIYGGLYIVPVRTAPGKLTFSISGIAVEDGEAWFLEFPFITARTMKEPRLLTPIAGSSKDKLNPFNSKR